MAKKPRHPKKSLIIRDYDKLATYIAAFARGDLNLLILVSDAGTGKSHSVRQAIGDKALWIEGSASAFGMYQALYRNLHRPVVIDDVDELFRDRSAIRLLKCLCQTDPVKRLSWFTNATSGGGVPEQFETTSPTIVIANEWETLNHNVAAVENRGLLIFFEPTRLALHLKVGEWFWDQEIYDFVGEHIHLFPNLSMRNYVNAAELKNAGLDWMDVFYAECDCERTLLIAKLLSDDSFVEERDRVAAFKEAGVGSQRTNYNYKKKLKILTKKKGQKVPQVKLKGKRPKRAPNLKIVPKQAG